MKNLLLTSVFFCCAFSISAQMYVIDPNRLWDQDAAMIENVVLEAQVEGLYAEVAISFDLMMVDFESQPRDLREFVFDFQMDKDAVFNDSWLWIEDYISLGDIYERNFGTAIYEGIVDRQQDPSILTKMSPTDYELRVYPLFADSTRRVRLSYLQPMQFSGLEGTFDLPLSWLAESQRRPENVTLEVSKDNGWDLTINNATWQLASQGPDTDFYELNPNASLVQDQVDAQLQNSAAEQILATDSGGGEQFFQLLFQPDISIEDVDRNYMITLDYTTAHGNMGIDEVINQLETALHELDDNDKFNICYSDFIARFTSNSFVPATAENIQSAITQIRNADVSNYSVLNSIIPASLEFMDRMEEAEIVWLVLNGGNELSFNDQVHDFAAEVNEFMADMENEITIRVVDYCTFRPGRYLDGAYYYGNEYFYRLLSNLSGYKADFRAEGVRELLVDAVTESTILTSLFDIDVELTNGFTYGSYFSLENQSTLDVGNPVMIVGKYIGEGDFSVELNAVVNGQVISQNVAYSASEILPIQQTGEATYYCNYLLENEYDPAEATEVIETSTEQRLLSARTIFLCLEPGLEGISVNNDGDIVISSTEEVEPEKEKLLAYPNPFVQTVSVDIPVDNAADAKESLVQVYDAQGQLVVSEIIDLVPTKGTATYQWTPDANIANGVYIIRITVGKTVHNTRVVYLR